MQEMPEDFWPEIIIRGEHEGTELGYALTRDAVQDGVVNYPLVIKMLRMALWQSQFVAATTN
jgi:hypothetical protein